MDPDEPCSNPELDGMLVPSPAAAADDLLDPEGCFVGPRTRKLSWCDLGPTTDPEIPRVVMIGDSHARAILPAFMELIDAGQLSVTALFKSSCPWSTLRPTYDDQARADACVVWRKELQTWLLDNHTEFDVIVTTGKATLFGDDDASATAGFVEAWSPLAELGVPIVAIRDNPIHDSDPNNCLATERQITRESCAVSTAEGLAYFDALSAAAAEVPGAVALDFTEFYCDAELCPTVIGGVNVYRDRHHITATYARTLAPYLWERLVQTDVLES